MFVISKVRVLRAIFFMKGENIVCQKCDSIISDYANYCPCCGESQKDMSEVVTMIGLSTAYLTDNTLDNLSEDRIDGVVVYPKINTHDDCYGYFVYLMDGKYDFPEDLKKCVIRAKGVNAKWIMFDCDIEKEV